MSAVKKAELDGAIVLRVFEAGGSAAQTSVEFLGRKRSFLPANLLEESAGRGEQDTLRASPHEISTVRIRIN